MAQSVAPKTPQGENGFNVLDYGAVGDSKIDDSKAFLKAWADVCGTSGESQVLIVPQEKSISIKAVNILSIIGTGDDCIAIKGESFLVNITRVTCGPGHGISIGSLGNDGDNDVVEQVLVNDCIFNGSTNGARIKTYQGGLGHVSGVTLILQTP
ncbi:probable polygalacturonase At3g15720 [Chenopodium quinoa]|uniref:probable polygalacturonase At3g15720 n=1 Tax=Chenopodium quinoa TaxID=63459 RepID=UPI000B797520|nr:probable polygalacturonase At3g15720 [Chenopodium quinoa]